MIEFKKQVSALLADAAGALWQTGAPDAAQFAEMLDYPSDDTFGDLALPCFKLSKALRAAPPKIAAALAERLGECQIAEFSVVGGYLNIRVKPEYLTGTVLPAILAGGDAYGSNDKGKGKTVVLDYSSPNVSKPFHIGHLGTTVIGHSLKLLHQFCGYDCIGVNHLGDWGTQNGKQIVAYKKWGSREAVEAGGVDELVRLYVRFHEEAEKDPSLNDEARAAFAAMEHGDEENLKLWRWFIDLSLKEYAKTYKQLGITFESYNGESFYTDKMPAVVEELREKKLLKQDAGAWLVDLSDYNMPPCLILKSDGTTLYPTRDIAAALYRKRTYGFSKCIYVTSSQQCLHFAQWFKVLEMMGYDWAANELVHVPYGTVSVNGAKLSTREGNMVLLRDVFGQAIEKEKETMAEKSPDLPDRDKVAEQVGVGAIVFGYLYNSRIKDISFSIDSALSFDGNTGPYAQYTYARTCSILEKVGAVPADAPAALTAPEESTLLVTLSKFPEKVLDAVAAYEPSVITRYIIDICTAFNRFYQSCPILTADDAAVRSARILLTKATGIVLRNALHLICIAAPEKI